MSRSVTLNIIGFCLSLVWGVGFSMAAPQRGYNSLQDITVEYLAGELSIRLTFQKPLLDYREPVFFKRSAHIDFPQASVGSASRYFPVNDSLLSKIYASQFEPDMLRVRFMLSGEEPDLRDKFLWEIQGRYLKIRIIKNFDSALDRLFKRAKRKQIEKSGAEKIISRPVRAPKKLLHNVPPVEPVAKIYAPEKVPEKTISDILVPAAHAEEKTPLSERKSIFNKGNTPVALGNSGNYKAAFTDSLSLRSTSLKMFYMLLVVLGVMLLIFYLFKKFIFKHSIFGGTGKPVRVLSTGYLGPKKSIALVEVAGEILVLGIANENISLLSNIRDEEKIGWIKNPEKVKTSAARPISKNDRYGLKSDSDVETDGSFSMHMNEFSEPENEKKRSVSDVAGMIRENLERMKTVS